MTDLRQAAQQALEALRYGKPNKAITILREALEQPEQGPVAKLFGTLPVYDAPPAAQRPWQGLTDEDVSRASAMIAPKMKLAFHGGMYVAQNILKERNT